MVFTLQISTEANIKNFRKQLDNIGFCFDWDTGSTYQRSGIIINGHNGYFCNCSDSFYNRKTNKAESIDVLIAAFEKEGKSGSPDTRQQLPIISYR